MTRTIPPSLAPVVQELELERPFVITTEQLRRLVRRTDVETPAPVVIQRLRERGWLAPTGVRGTWEFIPGERAGPLPRGDPWVVLRATLLKTPDLPVTVALGSALWERDLADRPPEQHEVSYPSGQYVPVAIDRTFRVVRFESNLEPDDVDGLPVQRPPTVLVHLADRPSDVRSWASVFDTLGELVELSTSEELRTELDGRSHATRVRLAYLLSGIAPDTVRTLDVEPAGKVWFGPRRKLRRHSARWNVADTVLPFDPTELVS